MLHLSYLTQVFHHFRGFNPDVYGFSTSHPIPIPPATFQGKNSKMQESISF